MLEEGDALVFDFGGVIDDYCSDITRSAFLGKPPAEYRRIYETVQEAQEKAFQCVRPGVPCQEADRVARAVISGAGYGDYFLHRTGHGLGLDGHEEPYMVEGNTMPMQPGMVFSIEPGIYIPGRFGVRIEDIVVVTDSGADRLNNAPRALQEL
jgi:Xaa-Pro aminopeptidase